MGDFPVQYFDVIFISLIAALSAFFVVQLYYYLVIYLRIPSHRQKIKEDVTKQVSVIVMVRDSVYYVEEVLPKLLTQKYDFFEVIVVDVSDSADVSNLVMPMMGVYPNLRYTRLHPDPRFTRIRKLALTVGIKAAAYPNLLFTETDCEPASDMWLSMMAKGFTTGDVVLGYCGIEPQKGLVNKIIRCSRLMSSVRWLSAAIGGHTYRGVAQNLGYTSKAYFSNKGFNHLSLNIGDDDLFVRKLVDNGARVSVIINPKASTTQSHYGGWSSWNGVRKCLTYTYKYYPAGAKAKIFFELFSRAMFFLLFAAAIVMGVIMLNYTLLIVAASLAIVRFTAVMFAVSKISKRLGEKGLLKIFFIHDLLSPLSEALLSVSRRFKPGKGVWN